MNVVIVESPAKAKTIEKYLGKDFKVFASYGHIRDLPSKEGAVDPAENFKMSWVLTKDAPKHLKPIIEAIKKSEYLYLATDPDREGEAIAWHVYETLQAKRVLNNTIVQRIVFHEITKNAVISSVKKARALNQGLVDAYLARRALDYLVGFTLSPVLWRKLPGSRSAGRVQSVALRLITERELEIERFIAKEYWSVSALMCSASKKDFSARLTHLDGKKLEKFSIPNTEAAEAAHKAAEAATYHIEKIEKTQVKRHPSAPFITSTLQQEAARKLRFSARKTMQVAQRLYEGVSINGETVGVITYMRTDSVHLSQEALSMLRGEISSTYGEPYLPKSPNVFKSQSKNAQEAHEAIRPTDFSRTPQDLQSILDADQLKLYALIWKRTLSSQMKPAVLNQVAVDIVSQDKKNIFRANGSRIHFDGFLKLYEEGQDDVSDDSRDVFLPNLQEGQVVTAQKITPAQHFTQPPPRYTEARLVKKMEELGIGRPSTYANIIHVLQDRSYVSLEKRAFVPEERGLLVATFLENYFKQYVEYNFTADLEDALDDIAAGKRDWHRVLEKFWGPFLQKTEDAKDLKNSNVLTLLNDLLSFHYFPAGSERSCPKCKNNLHLKMGRFGAFIGCTNYPTCKYIRKQLEEASPIPKESNNLPHIVGKDPESGKEITLKKGPYGLYLEMDIRDSKGKPKRFPVPKAMDAASVTTEMAHKLIALPMKIGVDPKGGQEILLGIGRYGPYVRRDKTFASIKRKDFLDVSLDETLSLLEKQKK